jgi:hypothetical protein
MAEKPKKSAAKPKFYNPPNVLRQKAGYGGLDPKVMDNAEEYIKSNNVDFTQIAKGILERLDKAVALVRADDMRSKEGINRLIAPIMELKANGAMFKFSLISDVADIALDFLEDTNYLNDDGFEIVDIHCRTLHVIIHNQLRGTGGRQGDILISELTEACRRYHKKYGQIGG